MATAASVPAPASTPGPGAAKAEDRREILTPEGVPLHVYLAARSDRGVALLVDLLAMAVAIFLTGCLAIGLFMLFGLLFSFEVELAVGWIAPMFILFTFLIRSFYFVYFELRWQGSTPGKRAMGLRVIDRQGGQLRTEAVFARNLMREIEVYIPITAFFVFQESAGWESMLSLLWALIFMLMPFFNKDRLRGGDIVAGTWVVWAPKGTLLSDLASQQAAVSAAPLYQFSAAQLGIYGIFELQTLETVLRKVGPDTLETRAAVCDRIRKKIGWQPAPGQTIDPKAFLESFYAALRAHLETRMLFGVRRESKHDTVDGRPGAPRD